MYETVKFRLEQTIVFLSINDHNSVQKIFKKFETKRLME